MRSTGTIRFVNSARTLGFIQRELGGKDCFLLRGAIRCRHQTVLKAGDRIEFDVVDGAWGPYAEKVIKL